MESPATNPSLSGPLKRTLANLALPLLATMPLAVVQAGQIPVVPPITVVVPPPPAPVPVPVPTPVVPTPAPATPTPVLPTPPGMEAGSSVPVSPAPPASTGAANPAAQATVEALRSIPVSALSYGGLQEANRLIGVALERPDLPQQVKSGLQALKKEIEAELSGEN